MLIQGAKDRISNMESAFGAFTNNERIMNSTKVYAKLPTLSRLEPSNYFALIQAQSVYNAVQDVFCNHSNKIELKAVLIISCQAFAMLMCLLA